MPLLYAILTLLAATTLFLVQKRKIGHLAIWAFLIGQWCLTIFAFRNKGLTIAEYFTFDPLGLLLLGTLSIIAVPAFYHSYIFFNTRRNVPRERGLYYTAMVVLVSSLTATYLSNHIAVTWIFVELTTLSASALIYHNRNERTLEATWKYVFVCSVSITFVFIGILLLSIRGQEAGFRDLFYSTLIANAPRLDPFWLKLSFIFIFTGFTAKAGLIPMHTVGIDAKDKAPGPAGALLASVLVNVGFVGIFRFYEVVDNTLVIGWANTVILISGVLSVFISAVYIIRVKNLKRMLAYSGLEHMGIVMIGLAAGGAGHFAALLHVLMHSFAKSALFFQVDQIYRVYRSKSIYDIGEYFRYNTPGAVVLLLSFFVITAIPPSGLFVSELIIFRALLESGHVWILVLTLILLTLIIASLGKNIFKMLFIRTVGFTGVRAGSVHPTETISQYLLIALVIYLGFNPPVEIIDLIHEATSNLKRP